MSLSSVSWHRTGTTVRNPESPAVFVMRLLKATAVGKHPSDRLMAVEAFLTDSLPANCGGSAYPSSERCSVGSRYLIAERSAVGPQTSVAGELTVDSTGQRNEVISSCTLYFAEWGIRPTNHVAARGGCQPAGWSACRKAQKGRVHEAGLAAEVVLSVEFPGGITGLDLHAACQWSGRRSPSCPAGSVGKRVSTSCKYAHGSTPIR